MKAADVSVGAPVRFRWPDGLVSRARVTLSFPAQDENGLPLLAVRIQTENGAAVWTTADLLLSPYEERDE